MKRLLLLSALLIFACSSDDDSTNESPIITVIGETIVTVNTFSTYIDSGAIASDNEDGDLTSSIVTTGLVNTSINGDYTITYTVSDSTGNTVTATRQVIVEDDGNPVYLAENGVTIKAKDWALIGDSGVINGIGYTIVNRETLFDMIQAGDDVTRVCTTRILDIYGFIGNNTTFNQPIGNWDVSNVTQMRNLFKAAYSFNQNISNWDVSNVTDMKSMFHAATAFNQDISNWDVSNVTNMGLMFHQADFNLDLGNWNVDNVVECTDFSHYGNPNWTLPQPNFTNCSPH